jgi:SRSO17 transposase
METEEHTKRTHSAEEEKLSIISQGARTLAELSGRIAPHFKRAEARKRVGRYLRGLLAPMERKNGWQMAEELGDPNVHGVQRLLAEADWDEEAVRDDLRAYVIEHLGEASGVLVVDETGFIKKGKKSAGVARQYSGTAGRRENSQVGVFLEYASTKGFAFIDRALYLPEEWTSDRVRCREAGIPDEVGFATKGELAKRMLARAYASGVPAEWVVGDTVYGYDELRIWLDEQQKNYVLAVPETHSVWVSGRQQPVGLLAALLPADAWVVLSAGEGSKGPRLYEWAWLQLPGKTAGPQERARFLLMRRSLADPARRAYYRVAGPSQTTLPQVVHVAGSRWRVEEGYEQAKGEVGLDQYEVRTWHAWYRYITLALLAYAALVVMQGQARALEKKEEEPTSASN